MGVFPAIVFWSLSRRFVWASFICIVLFICFARFLCIGHFRFLYLPDSFVAFLFLFIVVTLSLYVKLSRTTNGLESRGGDCVLTLIFIYASMARRATGYNCFVPLSLWLNSRKASGPGSRVSNSTIM